MPTPVPPTSTPVPPVPTPVPTPMPPAPHPQPNPAPSDPSAPAPVPKPNRAGRLEVSGQARVGSVLTATLTDEDGVPSAVAYQWFSGGQPIADAIESSYRLQAGDAGRAVYVQAVYTDLLGHAETVRSAPTAAVLVANLQGAISIRGNPTVGQTLTAQLSDGNGVPDTGVAYQWLAGDAPIAAAQSASYVVQAGDVGQTLTVRAAYIDRAGYPELVESVPTSQVAAATPQPNPGGYVVHMHPRFGKYVNVGDFGADTAGQRDSIDAIRKALTAAHREGVALRLHSTLLISQQIKLDDSNRGVTALFGDGPDKTEIRFGWKQFGAPFDSDNNTDDIRDHADVLIDGQSNKIIANLAVKYTNDDFYRRGESYFGKVSCIMVSDADGTLVDNVQASGANRAGVIFTSARAHSRYPGTNPGALARHVSYKALYRDGRIPRSEVPVGKNNRLVNSHLHHNRVAGALVAFQQDFLATGNRLAYNGHVNDGGTGYGIATEAGSYNFGVTFRRNATEHNYRKGLDVHDGNDIVIEDNQVNSDRLYGISVYNREFSMTRVRIANNVIRLDPHFRMPASGGDSATSARQASIWTPTRLSSTCAAKARAFLKSGTTKSPAWPFMRARARARVTPSASKAATTSRKSTTRSTSAATRSAASPPPGSSASSTTRNFSPARAAAGRAKAQAPSACRTTPPPSSARRSTRACPSTSARPAPTATSAAASPCRAIPSACSKRT
ncbi:MAG: right-handed parallel beta-helix repeat-containing protein [Ottowia sp.]